MRTDLAYPRIAVTPGEPAGIGPDIVIAAAQESFPAHLVAVADPEFLLNRAALSGLPLSLIPCQDLRADTPQQPGTLAILPVTHTFKGRPGQPDPADAGYVLETLRMACTGCLAGDFAAMVTGPVNKAVINRAGFSFTGHTEYLAGICGNAYPVMMLANQSLRVALVTTHLPLSRVSPAITQDTLEKMITIVWNDLGNRFGIRHPHLLVCGLNPHAGEEGHLGREEIEVITPVLDRLRHRGLRLTGPVSADTAFTPHQLNGVDVVIAMYHDQGLPPLKALGFGETVNITLGLPIIRTSVDHGTALSLAGTGQASSASFVAAVRCAIDLANRGAQARRETGLATNHRA